MPRENKTLYALLGMLTYRPMSGYDMKKMSDHSIGHFWNENYGNIYPVLKKMESEKLVTMTKIEGNEGPSRKVYTITAKGREVFDAWMTRPVDSQKLRDELLLKVFFGQWTEPSVLIAKIQKEDARCAAIIEELEEIKAHMDGNHQPEMEFSEAEEELSEEAVKIKEAGTPYWTITVKFGLNYYSGIRKWCAESIKTLETIQSGTDAVPNGCADDAEE